MGFFVVYLSYVGNKIKHKFDLFHILQIYNSRIKRYFVCLFVYVCWFLYPEEVFCRGNSPIRRTNVLFEAVRLWFGRG